MNPPTKTSVLAVVSLVLASFAALLSIGNSFRSYFQHEAVKQEVRAVAKDQEDIRAYVRDRAEPIIATMAKLTEANQAVTSAQRGFTDSNQKVLEDFDLRITKQAEVTKLLWETYQITDKQLDSFIRRYVEERKIDTEEEFRAREQLRKDLMGLITRPRE